MQKSNTPLSYTDFQSFVEQNNFVEETPKIQKKIEEIYELALAEPESNRSSFIQEACKGDLFLINEVQKLFADDDFLGTKQLKEIQQMASAVAYSSLSYIESELPEGMVLSGRYEIEQFIKKGGMGIIYRAKDLQLARTVAIKVISNDSKGFRRRFELEAKLTAKLNDPSVVVIHDYGVTDKGIPYMVMEYLEGTNLQDELTTRLKTNRVYTPEEAMALLEPIIISLSKIHQKNILHRDLKPANIFLGITSEGERFVKLIDLGIARIMNNSFEFSSTSPSAYYLIGTPDYMSPEQIKHEPKLDERSDIYSLGIIFYELVTGQKPFSGNPALIYEKQLIEVPKPLHEVNGGVPPNFSSVIARALSKDRKDRQSNCKQLLSELHLALNSLNLKPNPTTKGSTMQTSTTDQINTIVQKLKQIRQQEQEQEQEYISLWEQLETLREDIDITNKGVSLDVGNYQRLRARLNQLYNLITETVNNNQPLLLNISSDLMQLAVSSTEENSQKTALSSEIEEINRKHKLEKFSFLLEIAKSTNSMRDKMLHILGKHTGEYDLLRKKAEKLRSDTLLVDSQTTNSLLNIDKYEIFRIRLNTLIDDFDKMEDNEQKIESISNELTIQAEEFSILEKEFSILEKEFPILEKEFPILEKLDSTKLKQQIEAKTKKILLIINELKTNIKTSGEIIQEVFVRTSKEKKITTKSLAIPSELKDDSNQNSSEFENTESVASSLKPEAKPIAANGLLDSKPSKNDTNTPFIQTTTTNTELAKIPLQTNSSRTENSPAIEISVESKPTTFFSSVNFFMLVNILLFLLFILTFVVIKSRALTFGVLITTVFFMIYFLLIKTNKK